MVPHAEGAVLYHVWHGLHGAVSQERHRFGGVHLLREFHALEILSAQAAFFDFMGPGHFLRFL